MAVPNKGGVGAWLAVQPKKNKSREGLACLAVPQESARAWGGIQGLGGARASGRVQFRGGRW